MIDTKDYIFYSKLGMENCVEKVFKKLVSYLDKSLDDICYDIVLTKTLEKYYIRARKKNCSVEFLSHSLT